MNQERLLGFWQDKLMDAAKIGNSRGADLKKDRLKGAVSDTINLICLWTALKRREISLESQKRNLGKRYTFGSY